MPIAIVLLRLKVHYSVEIKRYKSQIRIRITGDNLNIRSLADRGGGVEPPEK